MIDNGDSIGRTPCVISLRSSIDHTFIISKSGYKPYIGDIETSTVVWPILADCGLAIGWALPVGFIVGFSMDAGGSALGALWALPFLPLVIDIVTGPHGTLDRQNVDVTLQKE